MKYTLKSIILVMSVLVSLGVTGQDNFKKGYVITLENDTLLGKINDGGGYKNSRLCSFKPMKKHKVTEYLPGEIKGYLMFDDKYYVSKKVGDNNGSKYKFIEVLIEGPVSLYHDRKSTNMAFYIQKKDSNLIGLENEDILLRYKPEENIAVTYSPTYTLHNRIYRDTLRYVFMDSEAIQNRIKNVGYDAKSLSKLTKDYLAEKYPSKAPITYERNLKMYRPRVGIYGGIQLTDITFLPSRQGMYSQEERLAVEGKTFTSYPFGLFVNFPLPMLNDKLSFQLEVMANNIDYTETFENTQSMNNTVKIETHSIDIPLMFKYELFKGFISPSLGLGKDISFVYDSKISGFGEDIDIGNPTDIPEGRNKIYIMHPVQKGGWFGEVGMNFDLTPGLSFFASARYYTFKNLIVQKGKEKAGYNTVRDNEDFVKELETNYATLLIGVKF